MYSPKIKEDLIKALYLEKQRVGKPMTRLVNEAITEYLRRRNNHERKRHMGYNT